MRLLRMLPAQPRSSRARRGGSPSERRGCTAAASRAGRGAAPDTRRERRQSAAPSRSSSQPGLAVAGEADPALESKYRASRVVSTGSSRKNAVSTRRGRTRGPGSRPPGRPRLSWRASAMATRAAATGRRRARPAATTVFANAANVPSSRYSTMSGEAVRADHHVAQGLVAPVHDGVRPPGPGGEMNDRSAPRARVRLPASSGFRRPAQHDQVLLGAVVEVVDGMPSEPGASSHTERAASGRPLRTRGAARRTSSPSPGSSVRRCCRRTPRSPRGDSARNRCRCVARSNASDGSGARALLAPRADHDLERGDRADRRRDGARVLRRRRDEGLAARAARARPRPAARRSRSAATAAR